MFVSIVAPVFIILKVSLVLSPSAVPCEVVAQEDLVGVLPIAPLSSDAFEVPHELAIDVEGDALFTLSFVFSLSVFFFVWVCKKNFFFKSSSSILDVVQPIVVRVHHLLEGRGRIEGGEVVRVVDWGWRRRWRHRGLRGCLPCKYSLRRILCIRCVPCALYCWTFNLR